MNFGGWGVQAFITYFFISYIYYVLFIKRVYENHMIMCDGYIMLTFFISTHLINRNNCVASKLTYIYSVCTTSRFVEDFLRGPARRVCGQPMRERSSHRHDTLSREWRENPGARHLGSKPGMWSPALKKAVLTGPTPDPVQSDTRPRSVSDRTGFGAGVSFSPFRQVAINL